jgi:hypothetical protein
MWLCGKCNKAMFSNYGIYQTIQDEHGREHLASLCLQCARDQGRHHGWKTALGFLGLATTTGYLCYAVLLHA